MNRQRKRFPWFRGRQAEPGAVDPPPLGPPELAASERAPLDARPEPVPGAAAWPNGNGAMAAGRGNPPGQVPAESLHDRAIVADGIDRFDEADYRRWLDRVEGTVPGQSWWARCMFWGFAFAATASVSATLGAAVALFMPLDPAVLPVARQTHLSNLWRSGLQYRLVEPMNLLVMGVAANGEPGDFGGEAESLLLVQFDPLESIVKVVALPNTTAVDLPDTGVTVRLGETHALGGPSLAARTVSRNFDSVPVDRYARFGLAAFRELVDALGGVELYVPEPLSYRDRAGDLTIDLAPGWQTLNGEQAEQFVRFRDPDGGEVGRLQRQQMMFRALQQRAAAPGVAARLPQIAQAIGQYADTNLSREELLAIAQFLVRQEDDAWRMLLLPGAEERPDGADRPLWRPDAKAQEWLMRDWFGLAVNGIGNPSALQRAIGETGRDYAHATMPLAVQNASGDPAALEAAIARLEDAGFRQVYAIDDWPGRQRRTEVLAQQGDWEAAATVRNRLNFGRVVAASTGDLNSAVTVRLGTDWRDRLVALESGGGQ